MRTKRPANRNGFDERSDSNSIATHWQVAVGTIEPVVRGSDSKHRIVARGQLLEWTA